MAARVFDTANWSRRWAFEFFKDYDQPCFNICAEVDIGTLPERCRGLPHGFFLASLHAALKVANRLEPFRLRLEEDGVVCHDVVHGGSAVLREDTSFGFCHFSYQPDFEAFYHDACAVLARFHHDDGGEAGGGRADMVYFSVIPWVAFTSFAHASSRHIRRDIPRLVFGKYTKRAAGYVMPLSVEVHHALMDGYHVGCLFEEVAVALQTMVVPAAPTP